MEPVGLSALPDGALLLTDSAPIIHVLEGHAKLASRFRPLFEAHAVGRPRFAVTTITMKLGPDLDSSDSFTGRSGTT